MALLAAGAAGEGVPSTPRRVLMSSQVPTSWGGSLGRQAGSCRGPHGQGLPGQQGSRSEVMERMVLEDADDARSPLVARAQWASGGNEPAARTLVGPDSASETKHPTSEVTWAGTAQSRGHWPVLAEASSPDKLAAVGCRADGPPGSCPSWQRGHGTGQVAGPGGPGLQAARLSPCPLAQRAARACGSPAEDQPTAHPAVQRQCARQSCRGEGPGTGSPEEAPTELPTDSATLEETASRTSQADGWEGHPPRAPHRTGERRGGR